MSDLFGNRQKQSLVVLVLLLLGIMYASMQGDPDDPKEQVEAAVRELVEAAEKEDLDPFRKHLSEQVKDTRGRDKEKILKTLFGIFFRYNNISLTVANLDVDDNTNPSVITASLTLLMGGDSPLPTDKGNFVLTFREEDGVWRVWEVEWEAGAGYAY